MKIKSLINTKTVIFFVCFYRFG